MTFRLTMLPGQDGDCVLLSWGKDETLHHLLVDLGRKGTYRRVRERLMALDNLELFVMSHIDADHIEGALPMVQESDAPWNPQKVWYNARPQLAAATDRQSRIESLGARQGEKLARGIDRFDWPLNADFASRVVSTDSPEADQAIELGGGLKIRLLSPGDDQLKALLPRWDAELDRHGLRSFDPAAEEPPEAPGIETFSSAPDVRSLAREAYSRDTTVANGASIAFVAEFAGKRVLLAADAHSEVLEAALRPLAEVEGGRYRLDLLKVSHHGSRANTSKELPRLLDCTRFAFSTNGARHQHPDAQTIARLLTHDPARSKTLFFNYRQPSSEIWQSAALQARWKYECVMPTTNEQDSDNGTLIIDL